MSFDWKNYIYLSEELLQRKEEACLRSSISRGYYGVFCIARDKIGYKNYKKSNVHTEIIEKLKLDKNLRQLGWNLDELRRARNNADYNEHKLINKEFAERMYDLVQDIFNKLV